MTSQVNKITIYGNIVRAEIKSAESGTRYFKATVASDRSTKGDGATDFFPIVAFGDWIDDLTNFSKGDFVKVDGSVRISTFGENKRLGVEVLAKKIERPVKEQAA